MGASSQGRWGGGAAGFGAALWELFAWRGFLPAAGGALTPGFTSAGFNLALLVLVCKGFL